jgi:hypothetical protein
MKEEEQIMIYRPKKTYAGWIGLIAVILVSSFFLWGINYALDESDRTLKILLYIPTYLFMFIYVYLILGAFTLGYKIEKDALVIIWGFYKKRITWDEFNEIIEVKGQANFFPFIVAAWPGYMVGLYTIKGLGSVRMFATHAEKDFILLKTQKGYFGITPEDQGLLSALLNETGKNLQTVDMDQMSPEEKGISIKEDRFFKLYYNMNTTFLAAFAGLNIAFFFLGFGAPKLVVLLFILALALFAFNVGNAKRLFQFSSQGAYMTLLVGIAVTGIFIILSISMIMLK